ILAFGKTPRDLGVPGEAKLVGRGVSYCVVCDAPLFKGKAVAVVGWGEPAMDAAMMLCPIAAKVYLVYKGSTLVGHEELVNRCQREGVMEAVANSEVLEVKGGSKVEGLIIRNLKDDQTSELNVQGVFVEMGYVAKTGFVKDLVTLNTVGEIMVAKDQSTSHPGIFAAGDVTDTPFKQAIISAGEGAKAALSAYNYLQRIRGKPLARSDWKVLIK
ncbi:MAG: NAD(P)/FAD-dependent oxidoreductase, partial [Candidatus Bathyarchaeia archaeon]